jgi:hypothetical protein
MKTLQRTALLLTLACLLSVIPTFAQNAPSNGQRFTQSGHVLRIELNEKLNIPLQDIPYILLIAFEQGLIEGFDPNNPSIPLGYHSLTRRYGYNQEVPTAGCNISSLEGYELYNYNPLMYGNLEKERQNLKGPRKLLYSAFANTLELVEDELFDQQKSDQKFILNYVRLVYKDPAGVRPEELGVLFHYRDVRRVLEYVLARNRNNQAERRTQNELLELRLFNGYQIENTGEGRFQSLQESEDRRRRAIETQENNQER